jgi:ABC-2 type transport system permease protein
MEGSILVITNMKSIKSIKKKLGNSDEIVREMKIFFKSFASVLKAQIINLPLLTRRLGYYFKIWLLMSKNSFLVVLAQKKVLFIFLLGKILRFIFFMTFLYFLVSGANSLMGYSVNQTIFFFLTFMVIDTTAQFFYREVYRFRSLVVSGDFDLVLTKPFSSLFRVLMGGADVIDLITIPPLYAVTFYYGSLLTPSAPQVYLYITLLISGFLISTSFHILVLAIGIITLEVDHTMMIYRDISSMARFPVDIYKQPLRGVLTYLLPIGVMITLPAKALMGYVTPFGIFISISFGVLTLYLAISFWNLALQKYSSASSCTEAGKKV